MKSPSEKRVAFRCFFNFREAFSRVTVGLVLMTWLIPLSSCLLLFRKTPWERLLPTVKMAAATSASVLGSSRGEGRRLRSVTAAGG